MRQREPPPIGVVRLAHSYARSLALLLILPAFVGCLGGEEPAAVAPAAAASAEAAGAKSGEAPVAPKEAYAVDDKRVAYPVAIETTSARPPVTLDLSGEFKPTDCRPFNFGDLEQILQAASYHRRIRDLSGELNVGDVFSYNITLSFTNTDQSWADIDLAYGLGSTIREDTQPTSELRGDIVVSFEGQGYRASEEDMAWIFVGCDFGLMTTAIPYTLTATFTFAEGAVPAEAPMLVTVPEGASKMFVRGVAVDASKGVLSHFRVFRPDDTLLCECALGSSEQVAEVALEGPGEYVLIVDHTDNGFVSVALDAPAKEPIRPLASEWVETLVLANEGGAVDKTVELQLERVPLFMYAYVTHIDPAGAGKKTQLSLTNARGEPLRISWGGHLAWYDPLLGGNAWLGFWPGDWEFVTDHHAFAEGQHVGRVTADELRGEIYLITRQYVR